MTKVTLEEIEELARIHDEYSSVCRSYSYMNTPTEHEARAQAAAKMASAEAKRRRAYYKLQEAIAAYSRQEDDEGDFDD